ncbi:hypothetical protein ACH5RR_017038 [Cinchona calisaya]|uniref:alpha-L-fucosidase n=1 Tax=Cinchona calisaya TaxID=153742 RepID=A0ABD2ZXM9_9GENT
MASSAIASQVNTTAIASQDRVITSVKQTTPPLPILPLPSYSQLKWQQREIIIFFHFGVNTFTDSKWGKGQESPAIFNPKALDAAQWVYTAVQAGVSLVILTAKHHDGFCLWPSKYTDHSVIRNLGKKAVATCVDVGLYLSPNDRHDPKNKEYSEYYMAQFDKYLPYKTIILFPF